MRFALLTLVLVAASCSGALQSPAARVARAERLIPADPRLAELYTGSCNVCHTSAESKAPLVGDKEAWKPRLKKGMPALVQSAVSGFQGMPAGGQCFACTEADHEALIRFMALGEGAEEIK